MSTNTKQTQIAKDMMPYGVMASRLWVCPTAQEAENNRRAVKRMMASNLISKARLGEKGELRKQQRLMLTKEGAKKAIEASGQSMLVVPESGVTVRGRFNSTDWYRYIRRADTSMFMCAGGVVDAFRSVYDYEVDPFIFGEPVIDRDSTQIFHVALRSATEIAKRKAYPSIIDANSFGALYLDMTLAPNASKNSYIEDDKGKSFSNVVGILIDFNHKNAYFVFKYAKRNKMAWLRRSYELIQRNMAPIMRDIGVTNTTNDKDFYINTALILCETSDEIIKKAQICADNDLIEKPFHHVLPIIMKRDGMGEMELLLSLGLARYIEANDAAAFGGMANVTAWPTHRNEHIHKTEDGSIVYNGYFVDYTTINRIKKELSLGIPLKICCFSDQRGLYIKSTGISENDLILRDR